MSFADKSHRSKLTILYITSVCDPNHTVSASAFAWANALAERCRRVNVIALDTGGRPAPNVNFYSLRRSVRRSGWMVLADLMKLLRNLVPDVDVIFCQYSTKFVLTAAPFAAFFGKPIVFWWSHGHMDWRLRLATLLVSKVVTASDESFRIKTAKKRVIGHGVDIKRFSPIAANEREVSGPLRILSVGRITPVKDVRTIIEAAGILKQRQCRFTLQLIGDIAGKRDVAYAAGLRDLVRSLGLEGNVEFSEPVPHERVAEVLRSADVFVNAQAPGGVGRAWLEAMATGLPTVICTPTLNGILSAELRQKLIFEDKKPADLAEKLLGLSRMNPNERKAIGLYLRQIVEAHHSLDHLADSLLAVLAREVKKGAIQKYDGG